MKHVIGFAMAVSMAWSSTATAALVAYEGFNYTAGDSLNGASGGTGWSGNWFQPSGQTAPTINNGGLSYQNLITGGNAALDNATFTRVASRTWNTTGLTSDGSVVWFSALFAPFPGNGSDVRVFVIGGVDSDPVNSPGGAGFLASRDTLTPNAGTVVARIGTVASPTLTYVGTEAQLVVGRITFSDTNNQDEIRLWLNPDLGVGPPPDIDGVAVLGNISSTGNLLLRQGLDWQGLVDELRIGTTFASVTPIPEPATVGLWAMAGMAVMGASLVRRRCRV